MAGVLWEDLRDALATIRRLDPDEYEAISREVLAELARLEQLDRRRHRHALTPTLDGDDTEGP